MSEPQEPLEFRYDPRTLREILDDPSIVAARIDQLRVDIAGAPDEIAELTARGDLVGLLRVRGELDAALEEARVAVDRARIAGPATSAGTGSATSARPGPATSARPGPTAHQHLARLRLAHVHQWRGEFGESDAIISLLLDHLHDFGPVIEAFTHDYAGTNDYDQGRFASAAEHFAAALHIRERLELPAEDSRQALQAARDRAGEDSR